MDQPALLFITAEQLVLAVFPDKKVILLKN